MRALLRRLGSLFRRPVPERYGSRPIAEVAEDPSVPRRIRKAARRLSVRILNCIVELQSVKGRADAMLALYEKDLLAARRRGVPEHVIMRTDGRKCFEARQVRKKAEQQLDIMSLLLTGKTRGELAGEQCGRRETK